MEGFTFVNRTWQPLPLPLRYLHRILNHSPMMKPIACAGALTLALLANAQVDPGTVGKLEALLYQIDHMYVDSVNDKELVETAIVSMLEKLDPHSIYIPKEELDEVNEPLKGNFEGVGIQFNLVKFSQNKKFTHIPINEFD